MIKECPFCHQEHENVVKREIKLPFINQTATSQKEMCDNCFEALQNKMQEQHGNPEIEEVSE